MSINNIIIYNITLLFYHKIIEKKFVTSEPFILNEKNIINIYIFICINILHHLKK